MATTTTNFGWDIPQSTDLVKDGATAIAALGQDIDTALVDLKGGTTGQILAKASATDLDFSWVTSDPGLVLVKSQTVGTAVSSVEVTDAFSSTYNNYRIIITGGVASQDNNLSIKLGSTTTGYYYFGYYGAAGSATITGQNGSNVSSFAGVGTGSTSNFNALIELQSPNLAKTTTLSSESFRNGTTNINASRLNGFQNSSTQFTAFTILLDAGTLTGGTVKVYGYKN
jgi:hypothetical protein